MGLEEIISNIDKDTKAKVASVLDEAAKETQRIREDAKKRADGNSAAMRYKAQSDAYRLVARELSRANIESRKIYQEALTGVIDGTLDSLYGALGEFVKTSEYATMLGKLEKQARKELGDNCTVYVQKTDSIRFKGAANVKETKDKFIGGLVATSSDGRMSVDYTLESIFQGLREDMAIQILKQINNKG